MTRPLIAILVVGLLTVSPLLGAQQASVSTGPVSNDGEPWRIALYQGGPISSYQSALRYMILHLQQMGWLPFQTVPQPEDPQDTRALWEWLANTVESEFLEFLDDGFYSASWDNQFRDLNRRSLIDRLNTTNDIDLLIAMGTWAGQDLGTDAHTTPTMVISVSDALGAGIVDSEEDSGHPHLHAFLNPRRYPLQVELFHAIMRFQRLGIVYEDSVEGRSYAAVDKVLEVAARRGFAVIDCKAPFSGVSDAEAVENVLACHQSLAPQIDAMYITVHRGVNSGTIGELLVPLFEENIPTFSQSAANFVELGALFSLSRGSSRFEAEFYAETMAKILNGALPNSLDQVFSPPPVIAINLATAKRIGYEPPLEVLGLADEIYEEIKGEEVHDSLALR